MQADLLDRLFVTLAVRLRAFSVCRIQQGWRLGFSPFEAITIHYVLRGHGSLRVGDGPWLSYAPHSILVVPARLPHTLGAAEHCIGEVQAGDHCALHSDGLVSFAAGDGSADALFVCGQIADNHSGAMGLFELFQAPMVEAFPSNAALENSFASMLAEVASPSLGTQAMTEALMKQCLIILLRQHLAANDFASPLLASLQGLKLARAVLAVLEQPGAAYTVKSMAALAGMGRTSFAESFSTAFGQGPMEFVQRVRLRIGARILTATDLPAMPSTCSSPSTSSTLSPSIARRRGRVPARYGFLADGFGGAGTIKPEGHPGADLGFHGYETVGASG